jgi:hypothetical protein
MNLSCKTFANPKLLSANIYKKCACILTATFLIGWNVGTGPSYPMALGPLQLLRSPVHDLVQQREGPPVLTRVPRQLPVDQGRDEGCARVPQLRLDEVPVPVEPVAVHGRRDVTVVDPDHVVHVEGKDILEPAKFCDVEVDAAAEGVVLLGPGRGRGGGGLMRRRRTRRRGMRSAPGSRP